MPDETPNPLTVQSFTSLQPPERMELFVRLLMRHQDDLFRYIFSLLPHHEDAKDALQETCVALYRKFASYDSQKPFVAWAYGFAYLEVLKQRERSHRASRYFGEELLEQLARERAEQEPQLQARLTALESCLAQLPDTDRELIRQRYALGCPLDQIVERLGSSRRTLFRHLDRIRRTLFECINRRLQHT